jgi:2-polyprenyl-3-methyl-5-hydroxy-6-metoxy-1,4-benzoquinol methylase
MHVGQHFVEILPEAGSARMIDSTKGGGAVGNEAVLAFYRALPFNYRMSAKEHARTIRAVDQIAHYPCLTPLLKPGVSVLDVGCGTGWFSLSAAVHYRATVTGIDFNEVAVARAREVARALGVAADFQTVDIFNFDSPARYDIVASLGVLHHTGDCARALRICADHVGIGGHLFIGLYHLYGRRPFLDHFQQLKAAGASDAEMLAQYRILHSSISDETHLRSWFRDQVLHPLETQHTLRELVPVLEDAGFSVEATSINGFRPFDRLDDLFDLEPQLEMVGRERLARQEYYPGFFVFLARRRGVPETARAPHD